MAWTEITRKQHDRRHLRCASDCTDEEWALIERFMPVRLLSGPGGGAKAGVEIVKRPDRAKGFVVIGDGLLNASLPGWAAAAVSRTTGRPLSHLLMRGS